MKKAIFLLLVLVVVSNTGDAQNIMQKRAKVEALNSALHFANESAHGMLIVHRMLENYNQDINQYVDLESFKINFYTNKDLPRDIFQDSENWFYDTSPYEWCKIAKDQANQTKYVGYQNVISIISEMRAKLTLINELRFDLDKSIIDKDLTDTRELNKVYTNLERGVTLYDDYYELHQRLLSEVSAGFKPVKPTASDIQFPSLYQAMADLYLSTKSILLSIKNKEDENLGKQIQRQQASVDKLKSIDLASFGSTRLTSGKVTRLYKNVLIQGQLSVTSAKKFYETAVVPEEYKQYGKFYYYYNSDLINKFNRYGNGIVFELNNLLDYLEVPAMIFTELPHYFKVIYPKLLPTKLDGRSVVNKNKKILIDSSYFKVFLYDHMEDGDTVSINFNGNWVVQEMPIFKKRFQLDLELDKDRRNFMILHANNTGNVYPNTLAVDYYFRGIKRQVILESNLNESELVEIEYIE